MDGKSKVYLQQFNNFLENHTCNIGQDDYKRFEDKKLLLKIIAEVENSSLSVFDMHRMHYILLCSKFDKTIGYQLNYDYKVGPDFFFNYMHPDDFPFVLDTINKTFLFLQDLPPAEKTKYKLIVDYRLKNPAGIYMRFIQQVVVLELDKDGNIWLILKLFDLVSTNTDNIPSQRKLINIKTGKLCLFDNETEDATKQLLTKRELEILGLISQGYDSKNISDRLFISVNTVNNHRQNILSKTKSGNIAQALIYAKRIGIL
jgi:DNA-binding CsgD family transcriptional regulator